MMTKRDTNYQLLVRIESKVDRLDSKVDSMQSEHDKVRGAINLIKWVGLPTSAGLGAFLIKLFGSH